MFLWEFTWPSLNGILNSLPILKCPDTASLAQNVHKAKRSRKEASFMDSTISNSWEIWTKWLVNSVSRSTGDDTYLIIQFSVRCLGANNNPVPTFTCQPIIKPASKDFKSNCVTLNECSSFYIHSLENIGGFFSSLFAFSSRNFVHCNS